MVTPADQSFVVSNLPGERRMLDVLRDRLRTSDEIAISVSFLRFSGLGLIVDDLRSFVDRGGQARILTSTYLGITQPEALSSLLNIQGVECRVHVADSGEPFFNKKASGFHTKFFIFRNGFTECWVGSSNLTKGGLASNIEANLCHSDQNAIKAVEQVFDLLWHRHDVCSLTFEFIDAYAQVLRDRQASFKESASYAFIAPVEIDRLATNLPQVADAPSVQSSPQPNGAQIEALKRLIDLREMGETKAAVIAAPGIGKTFLAAFDAQQCAAQSVLFLSHRLEHLSQAYRTFNTVFGASVSYGLVYGESVGVSDDFVFATIQSARSNQILLNRHFDYVVIDEFHHAEALSYRRILDTISASFLLGLTATPERQDGHDVLRLCNYNVAYEVRLIEAINREWLIPFHYFGVSDSVVDYSAIPWRSGGFDPNALENALMLEKRVDEVLRHALEKGYDGLRRATVGFCAGVRHAKFMAEAFSRRGQVAVGITGADSLDYREDVYKRLADPADPLEWLFVADVLNEGVDLPAINSILFLRPTESATLFIQQLGRGLRKSKDCEVLTVIDFVGHHRTAWLAMDVLNDRDAGVTTASIKELAYTPPRNCEVILEEKTLEILEKIRKQTRKLKEVWLEAYSVLRGESPRPYPLDLWGRQDCPDFGTFRSTFGSWIGLRRAAGDAERWEDDLKEDDTSFKFLSTLERDWQQPRVYSYALVWGLSIHPAMDSPAAYDLFFEQFPRWKAEYKPLHQTKAWDSLAKKLQNLLLGKHLDERIWDKIPQEFMRQEVEGRIRLTLEKEYKLRHGGVLRRPEDLVLHRRYDRPEIVNHFGQQYDPASHNFGVITFGKRVSILTKIACIIHEKGGFLTQVVDVY